MKQKRIPLPLIIYYGGLFFLLAGYILLPMLNTVAKAFHFGEGFTLCCAGNACCTSFF